MATATGTKSGAGSYGVAPDVPIVFLPARGTFGEMPRLGPLAAVCASHALDCLRYLCRVLRDGTHACDPRRQRALDDTARSFLSLMQELAPVRREVQRIPDRSDLAVHAYFGVVPTRLSPEQHACEAIGVLCRLIADLAFALVDVNDALTEVECAIVTLSRFLGTTRAPDPPRRPDPAPHPETCYLPQGDPLERWAFVHHAYFLFNLYAEAEIQHAIQALDHGADVPACARLSTATMYIRAFSATMMHSGAVSSAYYREVIRPTMQPPAAPMVLTGSMQPEHAAYRTSLKALLQRVPESFGALAQRRLELALARDACLEADLVDIERHICLAHALVGDEHSLVQHEEAPANAVSALRGMYQARVRQYSPLMRFGDPALAHLPAAAESKEQCEVH